MDDPALPTNHGVGSDEKVEIMAARYAAGLPLFLDDDQPLCDRPKQVDCRGGHSGRDSVPPAGYPSPRATNTYSLRLPFYRGSRD